MGYLYVPTDTPMKTTSFLDRNEDTVKRILEIYHNEISARFEDVLLKRPAKGKWSAIECLHHVNLANRSYLKQFEQALENDRYRPAQTEYKPGLLGAMFTRMMRPDRKNRIRWKMKTMSEMTPQDKDLDVKIILEEFRAQHEQLIDIIHRARDINISKPRIVTALGSTWKFKFGDALSFIIAHSERHMVQALNVQMLLKHAE
jgi:hypothetical protein